MSDHRAVIDEVMAAVRRACDPSTLVASALQGAAAPLTGLAVGKAAVGMGGGVHGAVGPGSWLGPVIAPIGSALPGVEFIPAGHPLPDEGSARAGEAAVSALQKGAERFTVLLSGGASSMMVRPHPGISLGDYRAVVQALLRAGAAIHELNTVRKHIDGVKGGNLAASARAGVPIDVLVISDVPGDDLSVIGSGPLCPDETTFADAWGVLERLGCLDASPAVTDFIQRGVRGLEPESPKPGDSVFDHVSHRILASNGTAVDAARAAVESAGFTVVQVRRDVQGQAAELGVSMARAAWALRLAGRPMALVWGGEATVKVGPRTSGHGGRNQEMALAAAIELDSQQRMCGTNGRISLASIATDGVDGTGPAGMASHAGAIVTASAARDAGVAGMDPVEMLQRHASFEFFAACAQRKMSSAAPILTGPTGTNVCDVAVALIS